MESAAPISLRPAPGPRHALPGGALIPWTRNCLAYMTRVAREYGDVVEFNIGPAQLVLVNDPELIQNILIRDAKNFHKGRGLKVTKRLLGEGLLTSEEEFHRRQRRLAQPAFHRQRVAAYADSMAAFAADMGAEWRDGQTLDISEEMMRLTLRIVAKTLFDADVTGEADDIGEAVTEVLHLFQWIMLPYADRFERFAFPITRRFQAAKARLDTTVYRLIAEHRASGTDRGDLLSMLLMAQDEEEDGGVMSDTQVRDEAMTIFLAGHETTANALTWTWYLLSQHPEVEKRFHAEIDDVLGDRLPTVDDVADLPYTRMVLAESMRLYPPAWVIGRTVLSDYAVGNYCAPKDSIVLVSQWVTHRDPRFWPDPLRFDPERFTPEAQEARPRFAYYPFGSGPRVCIGEQFAWMEGILALATLARRWQPRLVPGHAVATKPLVTLRPKRGMKMQMHLR